MDSGGFFATLVAEDAHHEASKSLFRRAQDEHWQLVTTNAVLYETHALLVGRVRSGREVALRFLEAVRAGLCRVERVTPQDEENAVALLRDHSDKRYSLCDALSFVVMERAGIDETIAFDRHFRSFGKLTVLE